ncbi:hypothetical protein PCL_11777 [Purpureocillium lilacinum]|uniref:Uncharacterized protein n=1 Tax=Purpureocillium lilacinum TaxID=33203 RepID=A0A2U3EB41_PURLI|nr:hypothetical protein Purlil1_6386 [Purpureocillium lilacinum]PWI71683.1 hypothetical protein PCL_11777 [Purpureocillium lilacinum]
MQGSLVDPVQRYPHLRDAQVQQGPSSSIWLKRSVLSKLPQRKLGARMLERPFDQAPAGHEQGTGIISHQAHARRPSSASPAAWEKLPFVGPIVGSCWVRHTNPAMDGSWWMAIVVLLVSCSVLFPWDYGAFRMPTDNPARAAWQEGRRDDRTKWLFDWATTRRRSRNWLGFRS